MQQSGTTAPSREQELAAILENYRRINRIMGRGPTSKPVVIPGPRPDPAKLAASSAPQPNTRLPKAKEPFDVEGLFNETVRWVGKFPDELEKKIMARNKMLRKGNDMTSPPMQDHEILALLTPLPPGIEFHNPFAIAALRDRIDRIIFDRHGFTNKALNYSRDYRKQWMSQARAEAYYMFMLASGFGPKAVSDAYECDHASIIYGVERYRTMQEGGAWWTTGKYKGWKRPVRDRREYGQSRPRLARLGGLPVTSRDARVTPEI